MGHYQFFRMDRAGARSDAMSEALPDDAAAIRCALSDRFPNGCELWDGFRFVGRFYGPNACRAGTAASIAANQDDEDGDVPPGAPEPRALVH